MSDDDFEITPAMRRYLAAFDRFLADPSPQSVDRRKKALTAIRRERAPLPLSSRERDVLQLRAGGVSRREIASELGIGEETVKTHMRNITAKVGTGDPFLLARIAIRLGLVAPVEPPVTQAATLVIPLVA